MQISLFPNIITELSLNRGSEKIIKKYLLMRKCELFTVVNYHNLFLCTILKTTLFQIQD